MLRLYFNSLIACTNLVDGTHCAQIMKNILPSNGLGLGVETLTHQ
jgi:hypothetical protein